MKSLLRLFTIFRALLRYNLFALIPQDSLPWFARLPLRFINLFAKNDLRTEGVRLRLAIEELGPVFIKFGQMISIRRDLLPLEIANELAKLQDDVPSFPNEEAAKIIENSIQRPILEVFQSFQSEPIASASVAQVYRAKLKTDPLSDTQPPYHDVIVKVIRPGIEKTIAKDTRLMMAFAKLLNAISQETKRLHLPQVVTDYKNTIEAELDLTQEAANTSELRKNFVESSEYQHLLDVPKVYWDYCSKQVMVAEFMHGFAISDQARLDQEQVDRSVLATRGVEIFFTQLLEHNFFHADMHPGNILVDASDPQNPRYISIDCAIMGSLSEKDRFDVARILLAAFNREYDELAKLCLNAGWIAPETQLAAFASVVRSVCEPIFSKPISEISFGTLLIHLFQAARRFGMDVRPSLILLQKTLVNIEGLGRELYPDLDLWATAQPFLQRWVKQNYTPAAVAKRIATQIDLSSPQSLLASLAPHQQSELNAQKQQLDLLSTQLTRTRLILAALTLFTLWQTFN